MLERLIENFIYSARWILAPIYMGLSLALVGGLLVMVMLSS